MQSLFSKDTRVTKCHTHIHPNLQDNINSLPIVGDRYSKTRTRDVFASLIASIQAFDLPSYWYNLSSNKVGSMCQLLLLEECILYLYCQNLDLFVEKLLVVK